jgi:hypothetical protein
MFNWFKKKPPISKDLQSLPELQASLLTETLSKNEHEILKGTSITSTKNTVFIHERDIEIHCNVLDLQDHGNDRLVYKIAFIININTVQTFFEVMVAPGTNPHEAILNGVRAFSDGFLTGFFNSFAGYYQPEYEIKDTSGNKFHITYSTLQVQGAFRDDTTLSQTAFTDILFPMLKEAFSGFADDVTHIHRDYYLIKIYLSRLPNQQFTGECLYLNNQWEAGLNALLQDDYLKWKVTDQFMAKKQFIFIKRCA